MPVKQCECRHVYDRRNGEPVRGTGTSIDPYLHEIPKIRCLKHEGTETVTTANPFSGCLNLPDYIESVWVYRTPENGGPVSIPVTNLDSINVNAEPISNFGFCGAYGTLGDIGRRHCIEYLTSDRYNLDVRAVGEPTAFIDFDRTARVGGVTRSIHDDVFIRPRNGQLDDNGNAVIALPQLARDTTYSKNSSTTVPEFPGSEITLMPLDAKPFAINRTVEALVSITVSVSIATEPQLEVAGENFPGRYAPNYEGVYSNQEPAAPGSVPSYQSDYSSDYSTGGGGGGSTAGGPFVYEDGFTYISQEDGGLLFQEETPYVFPIIDGALFWSFVLQRRVGANTPFSNIAFASHSIRTITLNEKWYTFYDKVTLNASGIVLPEIEYRLKTDKIIKNFNEEYFFEVNWSKVHFQFM